MFWLVKHIVGNDSLRFHFKKDCAVKIDYTFELPIPKSWPKYKKGLAEWNIIKPISKPDYDNLEKFYNDVFNILLYKDDAHIVESHSKKKAPNRSQESKKRCP